MSFGGIFWSLIKSFLNIFPLFSDFVLFSLSFLFYLYFSLSFMFVLCFLFLYMSFLSFFFLFMFFLYSLLKYKNEERKKIQCRFNKRPKYPINWHILIDGIFWSFTKFSFNFFHCLFHLFSLFLFRCFLFSLFFYI